MPLPTQPIRLAVPALRGQVGVIRLTAAVVAQELDFDIEAIDDIRVAVDELVNALIDAEPTSAVSFEFAVVDEELVIDGHAAVATHPCLTALASDVLDVVADGFDLTEADGFASFRLRKRLAAVAAPR